MAGKGVSGAGIAAVAGGSILLWSAISGRKASNVLRELLGGKQPSKTQELPISQTSYTDTGTATDTTGATGGTGFGGKGTPGGISNSDWTLAKTYGHLYGVDPLILVAIGFEETDWGRTGLGKQGLILGVGAYDSGPTFKWKGLNAQLSEGAKLLSQHGVHTIQDVMQGKADFWTPDAGWRNGVVTLYNQMKQ